MEPAAADVIITPPAVPETHPMGGLHTFESLLGLLAATLVGITVPGAAALSLYFKSREQTSLAEAGGWVLWLLLSAAEVAFIAWVKQGYDLRQHPLPPRLALRQRRWPLALRPVMAGWWIAHLIAIVVVGDFMWTMLQVGSPRPEDASLIFEVTPDSEAMWRSIVAGEMP